MRDIIRTLRIDKKNDLVIIKEAEEKRISINSYYNHIIDSYVNCYKLINVLPYLAIPRELVKEFVDDLSKEKLIELGEHFGAYIPSHSLFLNGLDLTIENIVKSMKVQCQEFNWYQFNSQTRNGKKKLLLRHRLGKKWSVYLNAYYKTLFQRLVDINIKTRVGDDSLALTIPK